MSKKPLEKGREHRINEDITAPEVRLIGEEIESLNGIIQTEQALQLAEERGVDLVEVVSTTSPPICRLIEYSKFRYELKKKEKDSKSKQHISVVKEIRFGPNTDDHDFNFKVKHAQNFLEEGHKIKAFVIFHGRSIVHKDRGENLLNDFCKALEQWGKVEMSPKLEGKRMFVMIGPVKK